MILGEFPEKSGPEEELDHVGERDVPWNHQRPHRGTYVPAISAKFPIARGLDSAVSCSGILFLRS